MANVENEITRELLESALSELRDLIELEADGLPHGIVKKLESIRCDLVNGLGKEW